MLDRNQTAPCLLQEICALDFGRSSYALNGLEPCKHVYVTNLDRSRIPGPDQVPNGTTVWSVAAICQNCRYHLDLVVDFYDCTVPCPSERYPYHHLIHVTPMATPDERTGQHVFVCSSATCQAKPMIFSQKPVLRDEDIKYLIDPDILAARIKAAQSTNPTIRDKSPADVLSLFQSCIIDVLRSNDNKSIPVDNKMFKACFGDGIADLLLRLGFSKIDATNGIRAHWKLPKPPKHPFDPLWDPLRRQLEDVRDELTLLILQRPESEKQSLKTLPQSLAYAQHDFERVLSIRQADARSLNLVNAFPGEHREEIPYRRLGVVPHFTDSSIIWAFGQQTDSDPAQRQYYLDCLKEIAAGRQSESLQTEAAIAESLEPNSSTRNGFGEGSDDSTMRTYAQALSYLGATADTPDDFVLTLMTAKISENSNNLSAKSKALDAVRIVAHHRNSETLHNQLAGDDAPKPQMTLKKAHTTLGVSEDTEPELLIAQFQTNIMESPSRETELRSALSVIAEYRDNHQLNQFVRSLLYPSSSKSAVGEPRAIKNIGNTCYLNSLLQYLFTIKPLRELVAQVDAHKENIDSPQLSSKRVGDSQVGVGQIRRALKFAHELDKLFESLTTATTAFVTPSIDLARLTLVNVVDDEVRRRQSIIGGQHPPTLSNASKSTDTLADANEIGASQEGVASSQVITPENGEHSGVSSADSMQIDQEANQEVDMILPSVDTPVSNGVSSAQIEQDTTASTNPPPIPPRPQLTDQAKSKEMTQEVESWAQQQDVREVMQNVLSQLRWAIKAEGVETGGEQIDVVSRLFSGKERYTLTNKKVIQESIEPFFEIVLYLTAACDIYTALDDTFDQSVVEDSPDISQYRTITEIPPVLQISVSRVGYNKITGTPFKVEDPLHLNDRIYMDRYMADDQILNKRRQAWTWKSQLIRLKAERNALTVPGMDMDVAGALRNTNVYLKGLASAAEELELDPNLIDEPLLLGIERFAKAAQKQIAKLDTEINELHQNLTELFEQHKEYGYRLHAVFIHRGDSNAKGGHWFIYIYDTEAHIWRCYNDETITSVTNTKSIFEPAKDWMEGTSSFIVYVRESLMAEVIETVHRAPKPQLLYSPPRSPPPGSPTRISNTHNTQPLYAGKSWDPDNHSLNGGWDFDRSGESNIIW